ncbi:hypothetical protein HID58_072642 [Brassica napus]|uniref:(rape) hypothetical protein n=1 Tax=Brassica napus TaxID=3708 RepID=A0A816QRS1_BRANA|nr:uncharacterized protein LOC106403194 isoform X2 [Brassica napus]KAH0875280.1 hypothetical protein HID58_072642 [Brassica napus]CAF2063529.1 unnamed protein product [Brassica napus]
MTGELTETVDKTATCSAITEKRPNRLGGCVGVFFQLFDWNRRFAKRKLFSRKSLLPGKQGSKRFGRDEKMLKSKLNLIDDENRGGFPNRGEVMELKKHDMRPPSLVARLMGLDSIPSNHRDKGKKKKKKPSHQIQDNNKCGLFGEEEEEEEEEEDNGIDKSRPQKMQRTTAGVCDRRGVMVKKFGSEALQIKNVLTRKYNSHHQHQKLASPPVRSPRLHNRRNSRLIDAAARILEPGKRNAKYAIAYPGSSGVTRRENVGKEPVEVVVSPDSLEFQHGYNSNSVASCKACGSFVDVHGSSPVAEEEFGKNMACVAESTPFERSKRNVFWRNQEPSMSVASGKGRDFTDPMEKKAPHPARFPLVAQSHTFQSKRGCSSSPVNAINCKEKDFVAMSRASISRNHHHSKARFENSDLNVQRKSYTRVEESSNRSGLSTPGRKRRLACVGGQVQGSSSMSPLDGESTCSNGSPHRNYSQRCRENKGVPSQMGESNPRTTLDAGTVGLIQQKLKEFASQEEDEAIIGSAFPNKQASLILHELLSSIAHQQPYAETACRRKGKTEMIGNANSDYTSPGSVLDASFSNESCFSNSFDTISVPGQMRLPLEPVEPDWDVLENSAASFKNSTSSGNYQAISSLISHVSNVLRCLSNTGLISTHQRFTNAREVILHTELSLGTTSTTQDNYLIGPELLDELMIYAARSDNLVNLTGVTGGFLVDAMIEHLEERNTSCGLKKPSSNADASVLIRGVLEDVPKWAALARIDTDEVIEIEMEKWMDLETHTLGVGSEIAYEILKCLVGELATDLF